MKVLLADDHRIVRDGLRAILEKAGVEVIGEAANGHEAVAEVTRLRPDVVIMDITMPALNGIEATRHLTRDMPGVKILGLSMNINRRYVIAMLEAGAAGYLLKSAAAQELLGALAAVARGNTYLSPAIASSVVDQAIHREPSRLDAKRSLSAREVQVLQLIAEGKTSREIGTALSIAVPTVETHRRQIMDKLQLRSIAALTKYAIREGLTSGEE
jgi:two-component system, NarL family, response regulator NreC